MRNRQPRKSKLGGDCRGPVDDLNSHLAPDWWKHLFDSVYLKTDRDVLDNENNTCSDVDLVIRSTGVEQTDRLVDLCCGQGRHCIEFARRGYRSIHGIDQSPFLIWLAKRRARREGVHVRFEHGDIRSHQLRRNSADCITLLGNSFGYFDRQEEERLALSCIHRALCSGGAFVLDILDGAWVRENYSPRSWEWVNDRQFVCRERTLSGSRLIAREMLVDAKRGVLRDQFYAERLYSGEEITGLLEQAGFTRIDFHDSWNTNSIRNQDLGLMENRLFLTALA